MDTALSSQWRVNQSDQKDLELAEVLRSLQRVAKHQFPAGAQVEYLAEEDKDVAKTDNKSTIKINVAPIKKLRKYPVPAELMDVLSGYTLHEAGHLVVESGLMKSYLSGDTIMPIADIGEDIVVDNLYPKNSRQRQYIKKSRKYVGDEQGEPTLTGNPLIDGLLAFCSVMLYNNNVPQGLSEKGLQILQVLLTELKDINKLQARDRAQAYIKASDGVRAILRLQASQKRLSDPRGKRLRAGYSIQNYIDREEEKMEKDASSALKEQTEGKKEGLSQKTLQKILTAVEEDTVDISQQMRNLAQQVGVDPRQLWSPTYRTVLTNNPRSHDGYWQPDEELLKELQWLKLLKSERDYITERPIEQGKIHPRSLYRAGIDQKIFRRKTLKKLKPKKLWLLMDASGSMDGSTGRKLYRSCAAVKQVLPDARIYLYSTGGGRVLNERADTHIVRADDKQGMKQIRLGGGTPCGDAIIFVSHLLQKEGGGILLHFTDGEANSGQIVQVSYRVLEQNAPKVGLINALPRVSHYWQSDQKQIHNLRIEDPKEFGRLLRQTIGELWGLL